MKCIILSHVYTQKNDRKTLELVEFALKHWGEHNPESFIMAIGHGVKPRNLKNCCNYFIWPSEIVGNKMHHAQNNLLYQGLEVAEKKGFRNVLKSRSDTIHFRKNIFDFAKSILQSDNKLLVSEKTKTDQQELCDSFLYGSTSRMKKIYKVKNPNLDLQFVSVSKLKCINLDAHWEHLKNEKHAMLSFNLNNESEYYL